MNARSRFKHFLAGVATACSLCFAPASGQTITALATTQSGEPAPDAPHINVATTPAGTPRVSTRTLTLHELGQRTALALRGVEDSRTWTFGVPIDKNVTQAQLTLNFQASAELIEGLSHLSVLLNDEVVGTVKRPAATSNTGTVTLDLPANRIKRTNTLGLKLVAHYTLRCEAPLHPALWLTIQPDSALMLHEEQRPLPNDLSLLPAPFFEPVDESPLKLAFVVADPTPHNLQTAAMVASWFGQLAGYRGVDYSVHTRGIPAGHAIVIGPVESWLPALPRSGEPAIHMLDNPTDPGAKLLVLTGAGSQAIERAARALVFSASTLSGPSAQLESLTEVPRRAYDAPAWVAMDRPVALGEWRDSARLSVQGNKPAPIELPLRVPPDLAGWNQPNVPLSLRIHDTVRYGTEPGTLNVYLNRELIDTIALTPRPLEALRNTLQMTRPAEREVTVLLPVSALGAQPNLQFQFIYPAPPKAECAYNLTDTHRGAIDPASTLDLRGLTHYLAMPDMPAFGNALFPFTRMADLSETRVVLSSGAGPDTYAALLMLAARAGQATGYPATGLVVLKDPEPELLEGYDVLILDSGQETRVMQAWRTRLPESGSLQARQLPDRPPIDGSLAAVIATVERWRTTTAQSTGQPIASAPPASAFIAGFESPLTIGRSVIVVSANTPPALKRIVQRLSADPEQLARMQGSAVVLAADTLYTAANARTYHAGVLGPVRSLLWFLGRNPVLLTLLFLAGGLLGSVVIYLALRHRARDRLNT